MTTLETDTVDGARLVDLLDEAELDRGVALSVGYFFVGKVTNEPDAIIKMQSENDWVGNQVSLFPDQLVGFFSVNPIADSAENEIIRCHNSGKFAGIKLHLANSDIKYSDPAHLLRLTKIFKLLDELRIPITVHIRNRNPNFGYLEATKFIRHALSHIKNSPVIIAHFAGWGGYDPNTDESISAFIDYFAKHPKAKKNVYFDIAAIVRGLRDSDPTSGPTWWPNDRYKQFAKRLRQIGLEKILFGSDNFHERTPLKYKLDILDNIPLSDNELSEIFQTKLIL